MNPKKLIKDSKIAFTAPAGRIFQQDLIFALEWIKDNGWQGVYSEEIFKHHDFGYAYAGDDLHRTQQLQQYLDDESIDAIWFARGGYGSVKIIDSLDFTKFKKKTKWLIGYSDITVFHNHLNNLEIPTLHAVTAKQLKTSYTKETYASLKKVLNGETLEYTLNSQKENQTGKATGKLVGGNLSIIYSLLGSDSFIKGEDLILFIEDWQENWYHIDRMLMALKRNNLFSRIKGLIVGSFTKMDVKEENPNYESSFDSLSNQVIHAFVEKYNIPVAYQFPAGHIGDNRALVMGSKVEFVVNEEQIKLQWL